MDLLADYARNRWALLSIGLTLADFPAARWDEATPADLTPALASGTTIERLERSGQVFYLLPEQPQWPVTFAFKTREGDQGLLQITGATDNPRGVKIRYKLVQQTEEQAIRALLDAGPVPDGMVRSRVLCKEMAHLLAEVFDACQKAGKAPTEEKTPGFLGQAVRELQTWDPNLLLVTPGQEQQFAAGRFDDALNTKIFEQTLDRLKDLGMALPTAHQYLIDQFHAGKLSGARLEAARRILAVQVAQSIKKINDAGTRRPFPPTPGMWLKTTLPPRLTRCSSWC